MASSALSLRDNMLLQAAADGLSGEEMEARYGIPAAEAVLRVREILKSRDIWSELEQEQLLLADLQKLKQKIMDRVDMFTGDAAWASVALKSLSEIGKMLDKRARVTDEDLQKVSATHAKALLELVVRAFGAAKEALAREYPEVDILAIDEVFNSALLEASREP